MDQVTLTNALVREYLKKKGMKEALKTFQAEAPAAEKVGTADMVRALSIIKQYKANKAKDQPLQSLLQVIAEIYVSSEEEEKLSQYALREKKLSKVELSARADVDENARPGTAPAAINHSSSTPIAQGDGKAKTKELTLDVESAAAEYYAKKKQVAQATTTDAPGSDGKQRRKVSIGQAGSTPKQEFQFNQYEKPSFIKKLDPSEFGRKPTDPPSFNKMPMRAEAGAKGNVIMNSSNVGKYKVGMQVGGAGGKVSWVVRVDAENGRGDGPGEIELSNATDADVSDSDEEADSTLGAGTSAASAYSPRAGAGAGYSSMGAGYSSGGAGYSSGASSGASTPTSISSSRPSSGSSTPMSSASAMDSTDDLLAEAESLLDGF